MKELQERRGGDVTNRWWDYLSSYCFSIFMRTKRESLDISLILIVCLLYGINNMFLKPILTGNLGLFSRGHFNDLMAPILLLAYSNLLLSFKNKRLDKLFDCLFFMGVVGLFWEFVAPFYRPNSVTDVYDLWCYLFGATIYCTIIKIAKLIHFNAIGR